MPSSKDQAFLCQCFHNFSPINELVMRDHRSSKDQTFLCQCFHNFSPINELVMRDHCSSKDQTFVFNISSI